MGGMHGFGAIPFLEDNEKALFHHAWEARALAITVAVGGLGQWNLDMSRHSRERLPAQDYLQFGYYERWLAALTNLLVEHQLLNPEELRTGCAQREKNPKIIPLMGERVCAALAKGGPTNRRIRQKPRYTVGSQVRTHSHSPNQSVVGGHTRLPRYAMGCQGTIIRCHGPHVLPDKNAHGLGEAPEHLYTVQFTTQALWGKQCTEKNTFHLDLWESYFEPVK